MNLYTFFFFNSGPYFWKVRFVDSNLSLSLQTSR